MNTTKSKRISLLESEVPFLIQSYILDDLRDDERDKLDEWINKDDRNLRLFEQVTSSEALQGVEYLLSKTDIEKSMHELSLKLNFSSPNQKRTPESEPIQTIISHRRKWIVAASIIFVLGILGALYMSQTEVPPDVRPGKQIAELRSESSPIILDQTTNRVISSEGYTIRAKDGYLIYTAVFDSALKNNPGQNLLSTPQGGTYSVELSDGTKVWLNPSSSISFPPVFPNNERRITITGEVFFEVAASYSPKTSTKKPFIVEVKDKDVKVEVLGTHFNINAYPDEPSVKTTLVEGSLKVTSSGHTSLLKPGQQVEIDDQHTMSITDVGESGKKAAQAWKEGNFDFQKSDIKSLLREIGRWYNKEIEYKGPLENKHFGGNLSRSTNLSTLLEVLKYNGIKCEISGKKIIVSSGYKNDYR